MDPSKRSHGTLSRSDVLQFAVPAFVYFVNNNLIFVILVFINSTTFQIVSSLKTVMTGILFRLILKRELDGVQRAAILLLAAGAATSQIPVCATCDLPLLGVDGPNATEVAAALAATVAPGGAGGGGAVIGVVVTLVSCLNSAFAGVYSELLLKRVRLQRCPQRPAVSPACLPSMLRHSPPFDSRYVLRTGRLAALDPPAERAALLVGHALQRPAAAGQGQ
eukprot:2182212-Prymnesium_polylepis.1